MCLDYFCVLKNILMKNLSFFLQNIQRIVKYHNFKLRLRFKNLSPCPFSLPSPKVTINPSISVKFVWYLFCSHAKSLF